MTPNVPGKLPLRLAFGTHFRIAKRNGASTLQIAKLSFVLAFAGCERQLAVC
jgi:hypothetical protein